MDKLNIRQCNQNDEAGFVELNLKFMMEVLSENPYWTNLKLPTKEEMEAVFKEALSMPEHILIFIAEFHGRIVGYANTWTVYSIFSGGKALTVDDLYIDASYRGNGIGEAMMEYLIGYAKENDYKRVQLHAEMDNERAHNLYRKLGFDGQEMLFFMRNIERD